MESGSYWRSNTVEAEKKLEANLRETNITATNVRLDLLKKQYIIRFLQGVWINENRNKINPSLIWNEEFSSSVERTTASFRDIMVLI